MTQSINTPVISATIFYFDCEYSANTSKKVLSILEKYDMFPPSKIHIGKLTKNRFVFTNEKTPDLFIQGYCEKDVFGIDMASGDCKTTPEYWRLDWGFTYYKNSRLTGSCKFKPWNTLTIQSTHGRLQNEGIERNYISCIKDLIKLLQPFYVSIDDLQNKIRMMEKANETHFTPGKVQTVYWGNYFGEDYCKLFDISPLFCLPVHMLERINGGVFFTLSDSVLKYKGLSIDLMRKQIEKQLF